MNKVDVKDLTSFGKAALDLDRSFFDLQRLGEEIENAKLNSEFGIQKSAQLLTHFSETAMKVGEGIANLVRGLEEAKGNAEGVMRKVEARAHDVRKEQIKADALNEKFRLLSLEVKSLNEDAILQKNNTLEGEKMRALPEIEAKLEDLVSKAELIKKEAHSGGLRTLEKNADSVSQSLEGARRKLKLAMAPTRNMH